jgi:hydrogenase/urease accessory protein HupE
MALVGTSVGRREETPYAQLHLSYACPGESGAHRISYGVLAEDEAVVEDHSNVVDYDLGAHRGQTVLDWENPDLTIGSTSVWSSVLRFGVTGVEHILLGADHVLFVIALILGSAGRRQLVGILSTFTLAHSVTLISALLGVVSAAAEVVEPLIALSIAFVALENLLGATAHRYPVVFVFGLLHGLGFAGSLRVSDEVGWDLVVSLLSFNVGIEVGQALLAAVAVPLVLLVRHLAVGQAVVRGATVLVALFGIGWFIERIAFA